MSARDLDTVLQAYVECALWSSTDNADDSGGAPLDDNYGSEDFGPGVLDQMREDCAGFIELTNAIPLADELWDDERLGHDFWLTRNRHGAGFWDRGHGVTGNALTEVAKDCGSRDLYVGDDGLVYIA